MTTPIYFDPRWFGNHGIGRFANEVISRLPCATALDIQCRKLSLLDPLAISFALANRRHGCYFSPGFNPPLASPIPFAFTIHDLIHIRYATNSSALHRAYYSMVVRPAARSAYRIFTVSKHSSNEIANWANLKDQSIVIAGNAPAPAFKPSSSRRVLDYGYFLHVGRRAKNKNIGGLLAAFASSRARSQTKMLLTGLPDAATMKLVEEYKLFQHIVFTGVLGDEELADYYRGALALVFPSFYEGFGLPIIEAMACGTPVITANVTATLETAGNGNALLVSPFDIEDIAYAIDRIYDDTALRSDLAAAGLRRAAEFTWDNVGTRIREPLESIP